MSWIQRMLAQRPRRAAPPSHAIFDPLEKALVELDRPTCLTPEGRTVLTASCRDADSLPKIEGAGSVVQEPDGRNVQLMFNGIKVIADGYCGPWMTDLIQRCRGHHEPQEEVVFQEVLRHLPAHARMIELGGWWSFYTIWFLKGHPERRAVVLEPDPDHLQVGETNADLNNVNPIFVGGLAGRSPASSVDCATDGRGVIAMRRYTVNELMDLGGFEKLDMLHCDIQGAETETLLGASELLKTGRIEWLFISTHNHQISGDPLTHARCIAIIELCGGTIVVEHDPHESFSGDGLIVAKFGPLAVGWNPPRISYNRHSTSYFRPLEYDLAAVARPATSPALAQEAAMPIAAVGSTATPAPAPLPDRPLTALPGLFRLNRTCHFGKPGDLLLLPDDKVMGPAIITNGSWATDILDAVVGKLSPDKHYLAIDIGANVGAFSRQLLLTAPNVDLVHCVEPEPSNFAMLDFNVHSRFPDKSVLHNLALSNGDGELRFWRDKENSGNFSLNRDAMRNRPHDFINVQVRNAGAWLTTHFGQPDELPIIWKSDTQGSDELIVAECPEAIWSRVEVAIIELWRIRKPAFDADAFYDRIGRFPNMALLNSGRCTIDDVRKYLASDDWTYTDLCLWR